MFYYLIIESALMPCRRSKKNYSSGDQAFLDCKKELSEKIDINACGHIIEVINNVSTIVCRVV